MPKVVICDRCGKSTMNDVPRRFHLSRCKWKKLEIEAIQYNTRDKFYICGDCVRSFAKWLKEGDKHV